MTGLVPDAYYCRHESAAANAEDNAKTRLLLFVKVATCAQTRVPKPNPARHFGTYLASNLFTIIAQSRAM